DVGDPGGSQRAVAEALAEVMAAQVAVEDLRQPELVQDPEEQGEVIDAFVLEAKRWLGHADQITDAQLRGNRPSETMAVNVSIHLYYLSPVGLTRKLRPMSELVCLREPDVEVRRDETYHFAGVYCFGRGVFVGQ